MANNKNSASTTKKTGQKPAQKKKVASKNTARKTTHAQTARKPVKKAQSYAYIKSGVWTLLTSVLLGIFT